MSSGHAPHMDKRGSRGDLVSQEALAHPKVRHLSHTHPNVTFCNAERPGLDVAQSFSTNATLLSITDPHTRLRRHKATPVLRGGFHLRNATVNFELQRCEHDDRARVAQSETLVRPRG